jgi:serine/threonine-protein kinase
VVGTLQPFRRRGKLNLGQHLVVRQHVLLRRILRRDLKPANVKITPEGKVKVLDFGLAKALGDPDFAADRANSPAMTMGETRAGVVLGTAAYMSPEQAGGQPVDKRADVWAFGVVLYEMLAGKKAFDGKTTSHILVKVIENDPDWSALPPLPGGVQDLLERCLQKEPANRLRDIGDLKLQLQSAITKPVTAQTPVKAGPRH